MASDKCSTTFIKIKSIDEFLFNESAEFHRLTFSLKQEDLDLVYHQYDDDDEKRFAAQTTPLQGNIGDLNYYFFAFRKQASKPAFCDSENEKLMDQKTGYFLIVYNECMSAMFKQNISLPGSFSEKQRKLKYEDLVDYNVSEQTRFKYLDMQGIDGSEYAIRSKTFEGKNLRRNVSALSSSRYYIRSMRGVDDNKSFSMNLGTSRLNHYKPGQKLQDVVAWVNTSFERFSKPVGQKNIDGFLQNFAKRTLFTSFADFTPNYLLLNFGPILRILEDDKVKVSYGENEDYKDEFIAKYKEIDDALFVKLVGSTYTAKFDSDEITLNDTDQKIKIGCEEWRKIKIEGSSVDDYNGDVCKLMNKHCLFNVYFSNRREVYSSGSLFEDSKLLGNFEELLGCIEKVGRLDAATCQFEKYYDRKYLDKHRRKKDPKYILPSKIECWDEKSEFNIVEKDLGRRYDVLVCDDYGKEWADFIGVSKNEIEFFACKYKTCKSKGSASASNFQDVVGQAIKNLENFLPKDDQLEIKIKEWDGLYLDNPNIQRCVHGRLDRLREYWTAGMANPYFKKTCSLVVNFLSYQELEEETEKLKGKVGKRGKLNTGVGKKEYAYQQLQILSMFVHACKELGIVPKIYCRP